MGRSLCQVQTGSDSGLESAGPSRDSEKAEFWVYFEGSADRYLMAEMHDMKGRKEWRWLPRFLAWASGYPSSWGPSSPRSGGWHWIPRACSFLITQGAAQRAFMCGFLYACWLLFLKLRKKLITKVLNKLWEPASHYSLWFSPLWLFFQYLLNFSFLPPLLALQLRPLAWTITIARAYPLPLGPCLFLHCGRKTFTKYKHDHGSFLPKVLPHRLEVKPTAVSVVNPSQVWASCAESCAARSSRQRSCFLCNTLGSHGPCSV